MTTQTTTREPATIDGPTNAIGDAAEAVRSVADGVAARIPDAASTARDAIIEGDRQLRDSSDEMLTIGATLAFGLATGLLLAGANRVTRGRRDDPRRGDRVPAPVAQRSARGACKAAETIEGAAGTAVPRRRPPTTFGPGAISDSGTGRPGGSDMDEVKKTYRETEQDAKEAWRRSDGDEDLGDKVGNVGDEIRKDLGNTGDAVRRETDRVEQAPRR